MIAVICCVCEQLNSDLHHGGRGRGRGWGGRRGEDWKEEEEAAEASSENLLDSCWVCSWIYDLLQERNKWIRTNPVIFSIFNYIKVRNTIFNDAWIKKKDCVPETIWVKSYNIWKEILENAKN